jgi:hypothetical protein
MVNMTHSAYRFPHRFFSAVVLLTATTFLRAQASGFNFTIGFGDALQVTGDTYHEPRSTVGLAYQQDLDHRFGVALDFFYGGNRYVNTSEHSYDLVYSAKYFTSDNDDATAFYLGTFFGFQSIRATVEEEVTNSSGYSSYVQSDHTRVQFPLGIRVGVRGGLDGYFGELFAQAGYAIGNGTIFHSPDGVTMATTPLYFTLGFSFLGVGWDHRSKR